MEESLLSSTVFRQSLLVSVVIGILCRGLVLVVKNKQYPSRPQDYLEQIISSGLSAALGAIVLPAILDKEYAALTFFAIAIQQFQGLADQERITLKNTDSEEVVPKGDAYVEEIASTYESRSYISLFSALAASVAYIGVFRRFDAGFLVCTVSAIIAGVIVGLIFRKYLKRKSVGDIANVVPANIVLDGPLLKVNDTVITNLGLDDSKKKYIEKGLAIEIKPISKEMFGIINDLGQRQAIIHNMYIHLGIDKDTDEFDIVALSKVDTKNKTIVIPYVPILKDIDVMINSAKSTPILEISKAKQGYLKKQIKQY
ncbi:YIEGIA family protein [Clostridioides mangenotii]|uniref:YIEGIA domain-containing protein n=1 Tax=Metaclostridioides mangenotii TaxID=1540 RepID=UPI001C114971|nr:YIEGIA domain-containing protein [Clostridioides mangenotii]MBU5306728.1 YIEGIA family protein [Clostridioides mangenotii]MCR1955566.1 YIEGIA family protein [Clostridioides mangenotii]